MNMLFKKMACIIRKTIIMSDDTQMSLLMRYLTDTIHDIIISFKTVDTTIIDDPTRIYHNQRAQKSTSLTSTDAGTTDNDVDIMKIVMMFVKMVEEFLTSMIGQHTISIIFS